MSEKKTSTESHVKDNLAESLRDPIIVREQSRSITGDIANLINRSSVVNVGDSTVIDKRWITDELDVKISYDEQIPHIILFDTQKDHYTSALTTSFQKVKSSLYHVILEERNRYIDLYKIIEKYVVDHGLLISNLYQITDLSQLIDELYDFKYEIYCDRPLDHANDMINAIFLAIKNHRQIRFLNLRTIIKNEEFTIEFDGRFIAKIFAIQRYNKYTKVRIFKAIEPLVVQGIPYMPPEIEIIDIYQKLYNGQTQLLQFENILFEKTKQRYGITGAYERNDNHVKSCYEKKKDELESLKISIIKGFLKGRKDIMLIGPLALSWYKVGANICPNYDRLQIITSLSAIQLREEINKYLASIGKKYVIEPGDELELMIPKDFRTRRKIFSVNIINERGIKTKPFLEYFNTAHFDVVPGMIKDEVLIGQKFALLRFLFIDLWVAKFVFKAGKMEKEQYFKKIDRLWSVINSAHDIPPHVDGFLGIYQDFEIAKKKFNIESTGNMFMPYYPYKVLEQTGSLREFQHRNRAVENADTESERKK
jgi:hypothetical protein